MARCQHRCLQTSSISESSNGGESGYNLSSPPSLTVWTRRCLFQCNELQLSSFPAPGSIIMLCASEQKSKSLEAIEGRTYSVTTRTTLLFLSHIINRGSAQMYVGFHDVISFQAVMSLHKHAKVCPVPGGNSNWVLVCMYHCTIRLPGTMSIEKGKQLI